MYKFGNQSSRNFVTIIIFIGILTLMIWGNFSFVKNNPGGNDFLINWMGTKSLVKENISPYSNTVSLRIQRFANENKFEFSATEPYQYTDPLYSIFLYLPFSLINNFDFALAVWMVVLEIACLFTILISIRLTNWQPNILIIILLGVFSLFWIHSLLPILNGDSIILIGLCFAFTIYAIKNQQDELAGICLALSTINPFAVLVFITAIVFWAFFNRRWKIPFWFIGTQILLILLSLFFMPGWFIQYLQNLINPSVIQEITSPSQALGRLLPGIGGKTGLIVSFMSGLIILIELYLGRKSKENSFFWMSCVFLVLGQWVNIPTNPENFFVFLPSIIIILKTIEERWRNGSWINPIILLIIFAFPWILFFETTSLETGITQNPIFFVIIPTFFLFLLYWVRWWVKNPIKHTISY